MNRLQFAQQQIESARAYSSQVISTIAETDWYRMPEGVTHVAWQVGHLAVAEYNLGLKRIRGEQPGDQRFIPQDFRILFGKGSTPHPDATAYPTIEQLRDVYTRVHEQTLAELRLLADASLDDPVDPPHPRFQTKLGALLWCAQHEMIHAGQIGLLRRMLGQAPMW